MRVVYPAGTGNVGDELNAWMWRELIGDCSNDGVALLGVGSILNKDFCSRLHDARQIVVLGTGAGYGPLPLIDDRWTFHAVRGPRTAAKLGLPADAAVADAAYLLATLDWQPVSPGPTKRTVVIPHHRSLKLIDWETLCEAHGLSLLSPLLPVDVFFRRLSEASFVLAEAMHGAILADILRIPWRSFSFGGQFNQEKWLDWAEALELPLNITPLEGFYDPSWCLADRSAFHHIGTALKSGLAKRGLGKAKWRRVNAPAFSVDASLEQFASGLLRLSNQEGQMTSDSVLERRVSQLYERLNNIRRIHGLPEKQVLRGKAQSFFAAELQR